MKTTAQSFAIDTVHADMAYSSKKILGKVNAIGAYPYIPFRRNAVEGKGLWKRLFHYFQMNRDEFMSRYNLRSNVESTFSAVKRKFGDSGTLEIRRVDEKRSAREVHLLQHFVCDPRDVRERD